MSNFDFGKLGSLIEPFAPLVKMFGKAFVRRAVTIPGPVVKQLCERFKGNYEKAMAAREKIADGISEFVAAVVGA